MPGASALDVMRPRDPEEFERTAGAFLARREAENNLILGLITGLKAGRTFGPLPPFFAVVRDGKDIVGAAMRTPPLMLILAAGTQEGAIPLILDALEAETHDLGGVTGPKEIVSRAAVLWAERRGVVARPIFHSRIYRLRRVIRPRAVAGGMRQAGRDDRELVAGWFRAFVRESQPDHDNSIDHARATADYWIGSGGLRLWIDDGPVAMAGAGGRTPNGIRVSAVYTPPVMRRRGYASALVAALSQEQLDLGKRFCFLYTDLANPTSNKIYQDVGYEAVADSDDWRFAPA